MRKDELISKLEKQLTLLRADGEYVVKQFNHTGGDGSLRDFLGEFLVRHESRGWESGYCRSETCNHYSHDPWSEYPTSFILCRPVSENENQDEMFELPDGRIFTFVVRQRGYHFQDSRYLSIPLPRV